MTRVGHGSRTATNVQAKGWKRRLLPTTWCALILTATVLGMPAAAGEVPLQGKDTELKPSLILKGHGGPIRSVAYSLDSKSLYTAGGTSICLWNLTTGKKVRDVLQGPELAYGIVWSQDRKRIAFGLNAGKKVCVIDAATGKEVRTFDNPDPRIGVFIRYALSPDGLLLAAVNSNRDTVHVWDLRSGKKLHELQGPEGVAFGFAFSPDGVTLAIGGKDATVRLWDVRTGKGSRRFIHPAESYQVRHLEFSADGKVLAIALWGSQDVLCLWDVRSGKMLKKLGRDRNELMEGVRKQFGEAREQGLPFDDMQALRKLLSRLCIDGLAFSPDGRWLATAGADRFIRLWELATGKEGASWATPYPCPLEFSPDGKTLTSAGKAPAKGWPTSIAVWDRATICRDGLPGVAVLRAEHLETCWRELSSEDAARASRAVWTLVFAPLQTIKKADEYVLTMPVADVGRIRQAVADLEARRFPDREAAFRGLAALGERAKPALVAARAGQLGLGARKRIEVLLEKINDPLSQERLRHTRLVETLEHIGNTQAQEVLKRIAGGGLGETAARDAAEGLERLLKDSGAP